jgi:hypothetical protein
MRKGVDEVPERVLFDMAQRLSLPKPTAWFRRRAWLRFQRALDPLAPPRPLPPPRA